MKQYTKITLGADSRTELHDKLGLTGVEVSINTLPAGAGVPFVHAHKQNEEIYGILSGKGKAVIFRRGEVIRTVDESDAVEALMDEIGRL